MLRSSLTIPQLNKHVGQRVLFGHLTTTQLLILILDEKAAATLERRTLHSLSEDKCLYFHNHAEGMLHNWQTISQSQSFKTDIRPRVGVDSPIKQTDWTGRQVSSPRPVWRTESSLFVSLLGELGGRGSGCTLKSVPLFVWNDMRSELGQLRVRWCQKHYLEWARQ